MSYHDDRVSQVSVMLHHWQNCVIHKLASSQSCIIAKLRQCENFEIFEISNFSKSRNADLIMTCHNAKDSCLTLNSICPYLENGSIDFRKICTVT